MTTVDAARLFIGGRFRAATKTRPVIEAATESHLGDGADATKAEIDAAVHAARSATDGWSSTPPEQRAALLGQFASALRSRAESTSALISRESGLPISLSHATNGVLPPALLEYYAGLALEMSAEALRPSATGHTIVRREAVGVVAAIPPWNYPQALATFKLAPALAAGGTVRPEGRTRNRPRRNGVRRSGTRVRPYHEAYSMSLAGGPTAGAHTWSHIRGSTRWRSPVRQPSAVPSPRSAAVCCGRSRWNWAANLPPSFSKTPTSKLDHAGPANHSTGRAPAKPAT